MSQLAKVEPQEPAAASENTAMVSMFERMASDPNVDVDKLERLMQMRERAIERQAKADFDAAMAEMQSELPSIGERGEIKNNSGKVQSKYALWEDVNKAIKPIMQKHGFALSFRTSFEGGVSVTGVLSHRSGHREETSILLPSDTSGSKNAVQAIGSSVSYGKRYTAGALLNLTSQGEDDDGQSGGVPAMDLDWITAANDLGSLDEYKAKKAEVIVAYGRAANVPKDVLGAFNRAFTRLSPK